MNKSIAYGDVSKIQYGLAQQAHYHPEHRLGKLWRTLYREDWLRTAQQHVLSNTGARTAGVDGMTKASLRTEEQKAAQIARIRDMLKRKKWRPKPVLRVHIPKSGKTETRPLGIPTLDDRVIQEAVRMLLEPIWESDFLQCSCGFRPDRRAWDAISECYRRINRSGEYMWIIEGDIRKCFDRINHDILCKLVERRIADRRVVRAIAVMLKSGIMEGGLFARTDEGTPQGGVISPLLANIYLHELDKWIQQFGPGLTSWERMKRRRDHLGNIRYVRYADDFIILFNGPKTEALGLRQALGDFLASELHLELSMEKTHVTHATEGFDFLGYHIQYMKPRDSRSWLRITPSEQSVQRLRRRIKHLTRRECAHVVREDDMIVAINAVVRGWGNYYRNCSFTKLAAKLDRFVWFRMQKYLQVRHNGKSLTWIHRHFETRDPKGRKCWRASWRGKYDIYLAKMAHIKWTSYRSRNRDNPYREMSGGTVPLSWEEETPLPTEGWDGRGSIEYQVYQGFVESVITRDGGKCTVCGDTYSLEVHHLDPEGDRMDPGNAVTLCWECHHTGAHGSDAQ